jgi:hypothetical protein
MKILCLASCLLLCSCADYAITDPQGPGGAVLYVTKTGVVFSQDGYANWQREGVPATYFHRLKTGEWYISNLNYHAGNKIRDKAANPSPKP